MRHIAYICVGAWVLTFAGVSEAYDKVEVSGFTAAVLHGPARLLDEAHYVAFAGDYGFRSGVPHQRKLTEFGQIQKRLFQEFDTSVVNYEFFVGGGDGGSETEDSKWDTIGYLEGVGFSAVSIANNHAMDYGKSGLEYNADLSRNAGLKVFGLSEKPLLEFRADSKKIAIIGITTFLDKGGPGPSAVNSFSEHTVDQVKRMRDLYSSIIVYLHLGSRSAYPNPHEVKEVKQLIEAGADAVICTGSHWPKGFLEMQGVPVSFGTGNYLFSYAGGGTETTGAFIVLGIVKGKIVQVLAIPFRNDIHNGVVRPVNQSEFDAFAAEMEERSTLDPDKFYSDEKTRSGMWKTLSKLSFDDLGRIKTRHVVYGLKTVMQNYFVYVMLFLGVFVLGVVALMVRRRHRSVR